MPLLATKYFGSVAIETTDLYSFPFGLPGFESDKSFVLMDVPGRSPLLLLQSADREQLCFPALPVQAIDPEYELAVSREDLDVLEWDLARPPRLGEEIAALALVSLPEGRQATANLLAPVVIHIEKRLAVQAVRHDSRYSHQHPVGAAAAPEAGQKAC